MGLKAVASSGTTLTPSFTSVTTPLVIGGTAAGSTLTLQSTTGTGTTDKVLVKVGTNGGTTAGTFDHNGFNGAVGSTTPAAGAFTTLGASGVFTELKRASIYVYTAWDPTDVAFTFTDAPNSSSAVSTAASYITAANSAGTLTFTCVKAGLYRFSITGQNRCGAGLTDLALRCSLGGTATILLGTASAVYPMQASLSNGFQQSGTSVFYATMAAAGTVTVLPSIAVLSGNATTNFTQQCSVSAEYCGATNN